MRRRLGVVPCSWGLIAVMRYGRHMSFIALRKDLTEATEKCRFCPNNLSSLTAYVLQDEITHEIFYAGPTCARKNAKNGDSLSILPDLTKFTLPHDKGHAGNHGSRSGNGRADTSLEKKALEYLILREQKLHREINCSYSVLKKYMEKLKISKLEETEIQHILNIEKKAPENLRLNNLQLLYNALFWIDVGIELLPSDKNDFLKGVRVAITKRKEITPKQKEGVNKWLENIEGVPCLR